MIAGKYLDRSCSNELPETVSNEVASFELNFSCPHLFCAFCLVC